MDMRFLKNVLLKALFLFIILNLVLMYVPISSDGEQFSLYNAVLPGRERFPFGEAPQQAYNFSLYDLDAMFASHVVADKAKLENEFRIFLVGDSSVWGTLLKPQETLSGYLNNMNLICDGQSLRFYNLGYPTISLTKDLMIMQRAMQYQPDLIIWLTTLEAFPLDKQLGSPLADNNPQRIKPMVDHYNLPLEITVLDEDAWSRSLWGQRRSYADWIRLQLYGFAWAATGIDQYYGSYEPAAWDLKADENYYDFTPPHLPNQQLLWQALPAALDIAEGVPLWVVNEPIMISEGENSDIRYNFFYPRWAYDKYRDELATRTQQLEIPYIDAWDWIDASEFTNSAIHLTPKGQNEFAEGLAEQILNGLCR